MAEWIALPWKGSVGATLPWVRIPLSPPFFKCIIKVDKIKYTIRRILDYPLVPLYDQKAIRPPTKNYTNSSSNMGR